AVEAERLGNRLEKDPSRVAAELMRTPQGCDWLADRWLLLASLAVDAGGWGDRLRKLAADLLGIPPELRDADPRVDPGRSAEEQAALARAEVEALHGLKAEALEAIDAADRDRAASGLAFD